MRIPHPLLLAFPLQGTLPPGVLDLSDPAPPHSAPPRTDPATSAVPVVCLHGTVASGGNWGFLARTLLARGRPVAAPTYGERGTSPVLSNYAEVTAVVRDVLARTGARRVDLVGHSQGGLLAGMMAAAMLRGPGAPPPFADVLGRGASPAPHVEPLPPGSIRRVVCVSGSHRGVAVPGPRRIPPKRLLGNLFGPALTDQLRLRERRVAPAIAGLEPGPEWFDLVTAVDRIVPPRSAVTPEEYAAARTIALERELGLGVPHNRQPHDHGVGKLIARLLSDA